MKNDRDRQIGVVLRRLEVPAHRRGFFETVWAGIDQEVAGAGRNGHGPKRRWFSRLFWNLPVGDRPLSLLVRPRALRARHPVLAAVTAVAVVVAVAAAVLVGLPGTSRMTGPEPVSAAQVLQKMMLALSSGETLRAESTDKFLVGDASDGAAAYVVSHDRVLMRADGSFRFTQTDKPQLSRPPWKRDRFDVEDAAYDAVRGVFRSYVRGWEPDVAPNGAYLNRFEVTTGYPLGPPDAWPSIQGWDFGATLRALQVAGAASLETTTYLGKPAWVISGSTRDAVGSEFTRDEVALVTIDQQTCLPLRFQLLEDGVLVFEYSWRNVRVDEPLPDTAFTFALPRGAKVVRKDAGFRRLPLSHIAATARNVTVLPTWLPDGYAQKWTAATARRSTTANGVIEGSNVVAVQYVRGFDALTVTTRTVVDPAMAAEFDPVEEGRDWYPILRRDVCLAAGSFAGATASIVIGPHITVPHLWAVKDGLMLTVAGSATAEELIAVAESLQPYRPE